MGKNNLLDKVVISAEDTECLEEFVEQYNIKDADSLLKAAYRFRQEPSVVNQNQLKVELAKVIVSLRDHQKLAEVFKPVIETTEEA